jgi:hypothetical protein
MRLALGLSVHTGWAAAVVAGGDWGKPVLAAREHLELLGEEEPAEAEEWVERARKAAMVRSGGALRRLATTHAVKACAIVAKKAAMLPLKDVVAAHPRIHTAEGCFYREVLRAAAEGAGLRVTVIAPQELDAKDPRLVEVGKVVGKPWTVDWKVAVMAAWQVATRVG